MKRENSTTIYEQDVRCELGEGGENEHGRKRRRGGRKKEEEEGGGMRLPVSDAHRLGNAFPLRQRPNEKRCNNQARLATHPTCQRTFPERQFPMLAMFGLVLITPDGWHAPSRSVSTCPSEGSRRSVMFCLTPERGKKRTG